MDDIKIGKNMISFAHINFLFLRQVSMENHFRS